MALGKSTDTGTQYTLNVRITYKGVRLEIDNILKEIMDNFNDGVVFLSLDYNNPKDK